MGSWGGEDSVVLGWKKALGRNPSEGACALRPRHWGPAWLGASPVLSCLFSRLCISARGNSLPWPSTVSIARTASKSFLFPLHLHVFSPQLSPPAALKNHVKHHLQHQMCIFIKTREPLGLAAPLHLTLTLVAYIL